MAQTLNIPSPIARQKSMNLFESANPGIALPSHSQPTNFNINKAISLLLNHHSRPLLFRHTHALKNIASLYSGAQAKKMGREMEDVVIFLIICRQVGQEQHNTDLEFEQALSDAVQATW